MIDLRRTLLQLGEDLVHKHGFTASCMQGSKTENHSTEPVLRFLVWLDSTPEAREALARIGVDFHRPSNVFQK